MPVTGTLEFSRLQLKRDRKSKAITGSTVNVAILGLSVGDFSKGDTITITLDQVLSW